MAKLKSKSAGKLASKTTGKTRRKSTGPAQGKASPGVASLGELQNRAEQVSRSIVESAQQIWLAGVGAFGRAQDEGTRLFEALVKEGMNMEKTTRDLTSGKVDQVRDAVEDRVGQARERAQDTWDRLEKVFEDRVQRALNRLGVPGRDEIAALTQRVDALTAELRKHSSSARSGGKPATANPPAARSKPKPARKPANTAGSAKASASAAGSDPTDSGSGSAEVRSF